MNLTKINSNRSSFGTQQLFPAQFLTVELEFELLEFFSSLVHVSSNSSNYMKISSFWKY